MDKVSIEDYLQDIKEEVEEVPKGFLYSLGYIHDTFGKYDIYSNNRFLIISEPVILPMCKKHEYDRLVNIYKKK